MTDSKIESAKKLLASGIPPRDVAKNLGVSIPTLYRWAIRFLRRPLLPNHFKRRLNDNNQIAINCSTLSQAKTFSIP